MPEIHWVKRSEAARQLGVSSAAITSATKPGGWLTPAMEPSPGKRINIGLALELQSQGAPRSKKRPRMKKRERNKIKREVSQAASDLDMSPVEKRAYWEAQLYEFKAKQEQLKYEQNRKVTIQRQLASETLNQILTTLCSGLDNLAPRMAPECLHAKTIHEVETRIAKEINRLKKQMVDDLNKCRDKWMADDS